MVSAVMTHFCDCRKKTAIDNKQVGVAVLQYNFIYKNKL